MPIVVDRYGEALREIDALVDYERTPPAERDAYRTDRIERLLARLGAPHRNAPAIHLAGTKGKGSVAYLTARLLRRCDSTQPVGLFVSPSPGSPREQIMIDAAALDEERFVEAHVRVREAALALTRATGPASMPTRFEWLTALAFTAFARARTRVNVIEAGLGGAGDATNLAELPVVVAGIVTISRDHVEVLGSDLAGIAGIKGGIIRRGVPVVIAAQAPEAERRLAEMARSSRSQAVWVGRDVLADRAPLPAGASPDAPEVFRLTRYGEEAGKARVVEVRCPLLGCHQAGNAAMALALVDVFNARRRCARATEGQIRSAWKYARLPGRIEIVDRSPWTVVDGAHNAASAWALAETLRERFGERRWTLVFGAARDKDIGGMWRIWAPLASSAVLTSWESPRAASVGELLERWRTDYPSTPVFPGGGALEALALARSRAGADGLVVAAGSLRLAGRWRTLKG